jgi:hypothetical protein
VNDCNTLKYNNLHDGMPARPLPHWKKLAQKLCQLRKMIGTMAQLRKQAERARPRAQPTFKRSHAFFCSQPACLTLLLRPGTAARRRESGLRKFIDGSALKVEGSIFLQRKKPQAVSSLGL